MMAAWATSWDDGDRNGSGVRPALCMGGAVANLAGTAVEAYGLVTGSHTATMVGLALLGTSGLAAGTTCALTARNR